MLSANTLVIIDKLKQIKEAAKSSFVTKDGQKAKQQFIDSLGKLSKQIEQRGIDGLNQSVSNALLDFLMRFNNFLKDVNSKSRCLYEDFMNSIPDDDNQLKSNIQLRLLPF